MQKLQDDAVERLMTRFVAFCSGHPQITVLLVAGGMIASFLLGQLDGRAGCQLHP